MDINFDNSTMQVFYIYKFVDSLKRANILIFNNFFDNH